jgi:hypothetical protein
MTIVLGKWDKGVDFTQARVLLENMIRTHASFLSSLLPNKNLHVANKFIKLSVAYIQLMNGTRISEALEALRYYVKTKQTSFKITAKKTKVQRPVQIPKLIQINKVLYDVYSDVVLV